MRKRLQTRVWTMMASSTRLIGTEITKAGNITTFRASTTGLANAEWRLPQDSLRRKYGGDRCHKHTTFDQSVLVVATIVLTWLPLWVVSGVDLIWCLLAGRMWRCTGAAGELPRWRKIHALLAPGLSPTPRLGAKSGGQWRVGCTLPVAELAHNHVLRFFLLYCSGRSLRWKRICVLLLRRSYLVSNKTQDLGLFLPSYGPCHGMFLEPCYGTNVDNRGSERSIPQCQLSVCLKDRYLCSSRRHTLRAVSLFVKKCVALLCLSN